MRYVLTSAILVLVLALVGCAVRGSSEFGPIARGQQIIFSWRGGSQQADSRHPGQHLDVPALDSILLGKACVA